jgi:hypothetical protein
MSRLSTTARMLGCAALVAMLAACGTTGPTQPAVTEPDDMATAEAPTRPTVRVPIACDELIPLDTAVAAAGADVEVVEAAVASDQADLAALAAEQYGQLDCAWSVAPLSYISTDPVVTASVVPTVPESYWSEYTAQLGATTTAQETFPGEAYTTCFTTDETTGCRLDALIGDYWLAVQVSVADAALDLDDVTAAFMAAATAVSGAGDAPESWPAYAPGPRPEGAIDESAAAASLGATVERTGCGRPADQLEHTVAFAETGYGSCTYEVSGLADGQTAFVSVDVLPGGRWALAPLRETFTGEITPVAGAGADAYTSPAGEETTSAVLMRGDDLVLASIWSSGAVALTPETVAAIATALA